MQENPIVNPQEMQRKCFYFETINEQLNKPTEVLQNPDRKIQTNQSRRRKQNPKHTNPRPRQIMATKPQQTLNHNGQTKGTRKTMTQTTADFWMTTHNCTC